MNGPQCIWRDIFFSRFNNQEPNADLPAMWTQFKADTLLPEDIKKVFDTEHLFKEDVANKFKELFDQATDCRELLERMKAEPLFEDEEWRIIVVTLRDRESKPLDENLTIPIVEGGQTRNMTNRDIEDMFLQDDPEYNILTCQRSIPEELVHKDLFDAHFNRDQMIQVIKETYESSLNSIRESMRIDNPKMKEDELEKQSVRRALNEMKDSKEVKYLQQRESLCAEDHVQKKIMAAAGGRDFPAHIFRGVNTYQDVGQFLEGLGIKLSKLKSFNNPDRKSTRECETDVTLIAQTSDGPAASFLQVCDIYLKLIYYYQIFTG